MHLPVNLNSLVGEQYVEYGSNTAVMDEYATMLLFCSYTKSPSPNTVLGELVGYSSYRCYTKHTSLASTLVLCEMVCPQHAIIRLQHIKKPSELGMNGYYNKLYGFISNVQDHVTI